MRFDAVEVDEFFYNNQNPDVAAEGINPKIHFGLFGANEGRLPNSLHVEHLALGRAVQNLSTPRIWVFSPTSWNANHHRPAALFSALSRRLRRHIAYVEPWSNSAKTEEPLACLMANDEASVWRLNADGCRIPIITNTPENRFKDSKPRVPRKTFQLANSRDWVVVQHPAWFQVFDNFLCVDPERTLYDHFDSWQLFADAHGQYIPDCWIRRISEIRGLTASSDVLLDEVKDFTGRSDAHLIRNGVEMRMITESRTPSRSEEYVVGFVGHIGEWIDIELIRLCALTFPEVRFEMIGSISIDVSGMPSNVQLVGQLSHELIVKRIDRFDLAIAPLEVSEQGKSIDPIKVYEYLARGKHVLAQGLTGDFPEQVVTVVNNHPEFIIKLSRFINGTRCTEPSTLAIDWATQNTWDARAEEFEHWLTEFVEDGLF